nr:TonB-dependent receptor [Terriglobales bacterium]
MQLRGVVVALLYLVLPLIFLLGQTQQGRITGRVTDPSGAVIANAAVSIRNASTGLERTLKTNTAGEYAAPNLDPGTYQVSIEAPNFKTVQQSVKVEVNRDIRADAQMTPGAVNEILEVTGQQPDIETLNDTLGGTITNKQIVELPLQGRDFQNLLELRPGVQRTPGGGFHSVTSNGNRTDDNNYVVDGVDDNDPYYGETVINNAGVQGTPASHLPLDAIQEFNTEENQNADYGWKPGVVVNLGIKSGTNDVHGTAYYFHRNSAFDARNYFNPEPQPLSSLLLHQFGTSVGGPIVKDKLFYFLTYEGVRDRVGNPYNVSSPVTTSIGNPDVSIPDAIAACACTPNPLSLQVAKFFLPNPGYTASATAPTLINFDFNNTNREDNAVIKLDYHLNEKNVFSTRVVYGNSLQNEEDTNALAPQFLSQANTNATVFGVNCTYTPGSHWVNEARFGFNRFWQKIYPIDAFANPATAYGIDTGVTNPILFGFPRISISPFDYLGGNSSWPLYTTPNTTFQFVDNVSYTHGSHSVRFGGEFRYGSSDYLRDTYGRGRVRFSDLEDFIAGNVRSRDFGGGNLLVGDTRRLLTLPAVGFFIQDDWRIRRNVTLNLGLRYDLSLPIHEANNQLANLIPGRGIIQVGDGIGSIYPTDTNNFSPRIGVAWDVFGKGKTVVRAGGAIIFEQPSIRDFVNAGGVNNNPSSASSGVTPGTGNINTFTLSLNADQINWTGTALAGPGSQPIFNTNINGSCSTDFTCDFAGISPNLRTPYVSSWNLNVQQELARNTVLQVGYVGNHGIDLYSHRDINQFDNATGQYPFGTLYPYIAFTDFIEN